PEQELDELQLVAAYGSGVAFLGLLSLDLLRLGLALPFPLALAAGLGYGRGRHAAVALADAPGWRTRGGPDLWRLANQTGSQGGEVVLRWRGLRGRGDGRRRCLRLIGWIRFQLLRDLL